MRDAAAFRDRARGALLGTALGDALGAPFEGRRDLAAEEVERWLDDDAPLTWTDDTAMALGLARSLAACGGQVDPQHLGDTFAAAYRNEPWRGYGAGPPQVFAAAEQGTPYVEAAASLFDGSGSYGNGAAMRAAPAGVVAAGDVTGAARVARAQAVVTHSHPLGVDGAALLAMCVAVAMTGQDPQDRLDAVADELETDRMRTAVAEVAELVHETDPAVVARRLGHGVAALESVPTAVAIALAPAHEPEEVLVSAVAAGGDTDTIAAMAGAILGSRLGAAAFPEHLAQRLERRDELSKAADELAGVSRR